MRKLEKSSSDLYGKELGLEYDRVEIVPYISEWKKIYEKEEQLLYSVLEGYNVDIRHIGSTSIPGLAAKPIIDIMIGFKNLDSTRECTLEIIELGYYYFGECGRPGRKFFVKTQQGLTTHHLHIVEKGSKYWENNLLFKDILTNNSKIAQEYENLKKDLARKYRNDRDAYKENKSNFIDNVLSGLYF